MLNFKINNKSIKIYKKYKYFNNFFFNNYINLSVKSGNSKSFKRLYIKYFFKNFLLNINVNNLYNFYKNNLINIYSLNSIILFFLNSKVYDVMFSPIKNLKYVNNRKVYKYSISFSILYKKKRKYFFLKYMKYFFFSDNWMLGISNLIKFNLFSNTNKSSVTNVYKKIFKYVVLKKK